MEKIIPQQLHALAHACPTPLYLVGGCVRDYLSNLTPCGVRDFDICAPLSPDAFIPIALASHFTVRSVYKATGTIKLCDSENNEYEYSTFRSDKYVRGIHTPVETVFTTDITLDAKRRDFTANAVYYDVKRGEFCDPLGGIPAIHEKRFTTVAPAEKVFGEDGLRLMRLARQAGQLGFSPDEECIAGASQNASLIRDITPERVFAELCLTLHADQKYGVAYAQYAGIKLLDTTRVLDYILPELTLGRGVTQRADYHKYDILEHSLRAVKYADTSVRLASLLHDIGKPFCAFRDGNVYAHPEEGARIAETVLHRLKAPKKAMVRICELVKLHMYDFNCKTSENKLRRFFVEHYPVLDDLLLVKQADFSACTDDTSIAPTVDRWQKLLAERAPVTLKTLAVTGLDLVPLVPTHKIAEALHMLLLHVAVNPQDNERNRLCKIAHSLYG